MSDFHWSRNSPLHTKLLTLGGLILMGGALGCSSSEESSPDPGEAGGLAAAGATAGVSTTGGLDGGGAPASTGGTNTGGTDTGGTDTGGTDTGGTSTGGASTGGTGGCPIECGTHKWACWRVPNPAGTGPNPASYSVAGGVVHDELTCLDWEQDSSESAYSVSGAEGYCEGLSLGGFDDWRLPTRVEMASILDWTRSPATDSVFSSAGAWHKTGSNWILTIDQAGAGAGTDYAWTYNMSDGIVSNAYSAATESRVRCVRGNGTGEGFNDEAQAPPDQYTLLSDGEARDNYTRLIWQRDGAASGLLDWSDAGTYCEGLALGDSDTWRLPTIRELATLVDEALVAPSINEAVFPNTAYGARQPDTWYWASHQARNSTATWGINFDDGFTGFNTGSAAWNTFGPSWAKCVRDAT